MGTSRRNTLLMPYCKGLRFIDSKGNKYSIVDYKHEKTFNQGKLKSEFIEYLIQGKNGKKYKIKNIDFDEKIKSEKIKLCLK